ncbi:MAG: alpha/beta hydrolase [Pseudomonadales bacterium]
MSTDVNEVGQELRFDVGDMRYAAKAFGPADGIPLLALHGWLDNAASFDVIAPMLDQCRVVAVDLSGQGFSSHRPSSSQYLIWSDLVDLLSIADQLGWETFNVIGHSRGGMISTLLAISSPERVKKLVTLDTLMPFPSPAEEATKNLREYIRDERKFLARKAQNLEQKPFATLDKAVEVRQMLMPIEHDSAIRILRRGSREVEGGYVWRHDERLKGRSAFKLSGEHNEFLYQDLDSETLFFITTDQLKRSPHITEFAEKNDKVQVIGVEGNHHFHLEDPVHEIVPRIQQFLSV